VRYGAPKPAGEGVSRPVKAASGPEPGGEALYAAIDVSSGAGSAKYPVSYLDAEPADLHTNAKWKTTTILLRRIPAGTFTMGKGKGKGMRQVSLSKAFYMGVFEVTQKQWTSVMGTNPSVYTGDMRPVEQVFYDHIRGKAEGAGWPAHSRVDAGSFIARLRVGSGLNLDLPTEAQWEYACRAETTTVYSFGDDASELHGYGNYQDKQGGDPREPDDGFSQTAPVGSYSPNSWGLYDMHGNVWEQCLDWHGVLGKVSVTDPTGPSSGSIRVIRGGSWGTTAHSCRSTSRILYEPGFRYRDFGLRLRAWPSGQ
jgi:formylglycine-generating enzyme required for sulfatase activity